LRIAAITGRFPVLSETFVVRHLQGLLALGHDLDIYAELRGDERDLTPSARAELMPRALYVDMPEASAFELPVRPLGGRTRVPGADRDQLNLVRAARAVPALAAAGRRAPRLAVRALRRSHYRDQATSLSALYRLAACSRGGGYDAVHVHFGPIGESYRFVRKLWGAPLVVSFHGHDMSSWPGSARPGALDHVFATADAVTTVSADGVRKLTRLGCPPTKLYVVQSGLAMEQFRFRERGLRLEEVPRILSVARLTEKKGLEYALRAVARVMEDRPLRYDIIGSGPLDLGLQELAIDLGIAGAVTFHGGRGHEFVRQMLDESHLFLLPSVTAADGDQEGAPVSLLEAQACGVPVLSTMHAGIPEAVVGGRSGLLVAERDEEELALRLAELLDHPERWPAMGRAGRRHVERRNDNRALSRELVSLYEALAG
jgi:colanic acid/amylovoran biosynthesis glycosyltransferase